MQLSQPGLSVLELVVRQILQRSWKKSCVAGYAERGEGLDESITNQAHYSP